ncbi:hypothetical protein R3P38DRAFT_3498152 [Favolaschia claudopus]|uniref:Uncharacterized protein n=1 Tax=Favolaschia claudopus TaxID=2862362 RepID=A0AAW0C3Y6_9AGAR
MAKSLGSVNLDLVFRDGWRSNSVDTKGVLDWLKFHDAPTRLIRQWEDIVYLATFDFYLTRYYLTETPHEMQSDELHYISDISPRLLDIIQAYILFEFDGVEYYYLRYIRWVLNISWQEMLASIATARRYAGEDLNQYTMKLIVNAVKLYRIRDSHPEATLEVIAKRFPLILADSPWVLWSKNLLDALRPLVMDRHFCVFHYGAHCSEFELVPSLPYPCLAEGELLRCSNNFNH